MTKKEGKMEKQKKHREKSFDKSDGWKEKGEKNEQVRKERRFWRKKLKVVGEGERWSKGNKEREKLGDLKNLWWIKRRK